MTQPIPEQSPAWQSVSVMDSEDMRRALTRIAHEIVEKNQGAQNLALVGILTRGVPLALRLSTLLRQIENVEVLVGKLDIGMYRDDYGSRAVGNAPLSPTAIPFDVTGKRIVLVDDVLFTGRSVRAAISACWIWAVPPTYSLRFCWTEDTANCPFARISSAKTFPPPFTNTYR